MIKEKDLPKKRDLENKKYRGSFCESDVVPLERVTSVDYMGGGRYVN